MSAPAKLNGTAVGDLHDREITVSVIENVRDPRPVRMVCSARNFLQELKKQKETPRKEDARLFNLVAFDGGRTASLAEHVDGICLDYDNSCAVGREKRAISTPTTMDGAASRLSSLGCTFAIYPTHSYTADWPKFRVVIPLARAIEPAKHDALARDLADRIGPGCDLRPVSQMYYRPTVPPGGTSPRPLIVDGELLDPDTLAHEPTGSPQVAPGSALPRALNTLDRLATLPQQRGKYATPLIMEGGRHDTLLHMAGAMRAAGFGEAAIAAGLHAANATQCVPPQPASDIDSITRDAASWTPGQWRPAIPSEAPAIDLESRLSSFTASDLCVAPVPRAFVWAPRIPEGAVTVVAAAGGAGKTTALTGLAWAIASGATFCGASTASGSVVIATAEDTPRDYQEKFAALCDPLLHRPERLDEIGRRLHILSLRGAGLHLVNVSYGSARISEHADRIADIIAERAPDTRLVVLETASRLIGADENANGTMAALIAALERIAERLPTAGIVLVHHVAKEAARSALLDAHVGRGGGALADNARSVLTLARVSRDSRDIEIPAAATPLDIQQGRLVVMRHAKSSYAPRAPDLWFRQVGPMLLPIDAAVDDGSRRRRLVRFVIDHRANHPGAPLTRKVLKERCREIGIPQREVDFAIDQAHELGEIVVQTVRVGGGAGRRVDRILAPGECAQTTESAS